MIGGTYGKILHVDLTSGDTHIEEPSDDFYRLLVGGRAVVSYFLLRDLPRDADPLGPVSTSAIRMRRVAPAEVSR